MTQAPPSLVAPGPFTRIRWVTLAAGIFLVLLGLLVIVGWLFHLPVLLQVLPGQFGMVFSSAVCFVLAGAALLVPEHPAMRRRYAQTVLGCLIVLVAGAMLFQHLTHTDLGIDMQAFHAWLPDTNPAPGRMAFNTALAFLLSGTALVLIPNDRSRWTLYTIEALAFLVILTGLTAAVGYALKLELLYTWSQYPSMPVHSAAGMIVLSIGLWGAWLTLPATQRALQHPTQNRIVWTSGSLFFGIALVAGLVGFASMQKVTEKTLENGLERSLQNRIDLFTTAVGDTFIATKLIVSRPSVHRNLQALNRDPGSAQEISKLVTSAKSFLPLGFSAVAFHDKRGRELARAGKFAPYSDLTVTLSLADPAQLLWHNGFLLETRMPINSDGEHLGTVLLQRPLEMLTRMMRDTNGLGETGEMGICALGGGSTMRCFPQRLHPRVFQVPHEIDGRKLPMSNALDGGNGVITTLDYRHQNVTAAYAPIGQLGLGMVVKTDTAELYKPIGEQLRWALLLLLALIAGGMGILHLLVTPLVRRLTNSEEKFRAVAETALDAIVTANTKGQIVFWNRAAETIFGYTEAQILGQPLTRLMPERYRGPHQQGWDRLQKTNQPRLLWSTVELHGLRQDGTEFPLELSLSRWETRGEQYFTGLMRDISRRKQAQQMARRLVNIVESSSDTIISKSLDGTITSWNAAAEWLYGYSAAEIIGKPCLILLPPDRISEEQDFLERLRRGERITRYKTQRLRKGGTIVEVALTVSALRDASGYIEGISIIARDLTERRTSPRGTETDARA